MEKYKTTSILTRILYNSICFKLCFDEIFCAAFGDKFQMHIKMFTCDMDNYRHYSGSLAALSKVCHI